MSAKPARAHERIRPFGTTGPKPPPSELARRERLLAETFRLRDTIGPIGMTAAELLSDPEEGVDE